MAREFVPALTRHRMYFDDGQPRYAPGADCNAVFGNCVDLDSCFGPRLSLMEPVDTALELVESAGDDSHNGCAVLAGFTPGNIAVARRGVCGFFTKAYLAQSAGAAGLIVVNDGRCGNLGPDSPDCVVPMSGGGAAFMIDIPVVMLSSSDGEALIAELENGQPVTAVMGAVEGGAFEVSSWIFSSDITEVDPVEINNGNSLRVHFGGFADGFECGDTGRWSPVRDGQ
jgi:hypothetical protein